MDVLQEEELEVVAAKMASATSLEEPAATQAQSAGAECLKELSKLGICGGCSEEELEEAGEVMSYTAKAEEFHVQGGGRSCSGWKEGMVGEVPKCACEFKDKCGIGLEEQLQAPEHTKANNAWEFEQQLGWKAPVIHEERKQAEKNDASEVKAEEKRWEVQAPVPGRERNQGHHHVCGEANEAAGWKEAKSGDSFFGFPPACSPSACLEDKSWGEEYVDVGYLEREVEVGGQILQVRVAKTAAAVEDWLAKCTAEDKVFGFDVEWRPNRFRADENKVALLQLSLASRCLLVQVLYIDRIPSALEELLADPQVKLAGVGVKGDAERLLHDYGLRCCGEVDLALYAAQVLNQREMRQAGLSKLSQDILDVPYKKTKTISCSDWAVEGLSSAQITYAASDAWISYSLLVALEDLEAKAPLEHEDQPTQPQPALSGLEERIRDIEEVVAFLKQRAAGQHPHVSSSIARTYDRPS